LITQAMDSVRSADQDVAIRRMKNEESNRPNIQGAG
jgi:hypothetical protein